MSTLIPLESLPNQRIAILLDGLFYELTLQAVDTAMAVTIIRDGTTLVTGARIVAETPLIPYRYLEAGNFIFIGDTESAPFYTNFGDTQNLIYLTASELGVARG